MFKFFHYINFKSVAWRFQYLLKFRSESNYKTWLMLTYGEFGIFAHKETIKQFLQLMIQQVLGEGGGAGCAERMCRFFASVFQSYCTFVSGFFNSTMPFWVDFTTICIFLAVYHVYFIKKSNSVLGTKFSLCTIDP